jgi:hypothetical protein
VRARTLAARGGARYHPIVSAGISAAQNRGVHVDALGRMGEPVWFISPIAAQRGAEGLLAGRVPASVSALGGNDAERLIAAAHRDHHEGERQRDRSEVRERVAEQVVYDAAAGMNRQRERREHR